MQQLEVSPKVGKKSSFFNSYHIQVHDFVVRIVP